MIHDKENWNGHLLLTQVGIHFGAKPTELNEALSFDRPSRVEQSNFTPLNFCETERAILRIRFS